MHAFDACRVGRYPTPNSPGKLEAYQHSLRMFRKAAKHFDPPLEIIELPFEGKKLIGYLQMPPRRDQAAGGDALGRRRRLEGRPPAHRQADHGRRPRLAHHRHAGHAARTRCSTAIPSAERTYFAWLDHLPTRADIDGSRVGVWGGSFGAYWAARLAYTAADRIKGAVFHGGNVHYGFQKEWLVPAFTTGGATYLFGAAEPARSARPRHGRRRRSRNFSKRRRSLSLKTMGLLDKPSAPLLGVNGKLDDQAPVDDIYLLMEHGNPKSARVYPARPPHGPHARHARG